MRPPPMSFALPHGLRGRRQMRFRATIELAGKTAASIQVPAEVVDSLGAGRKPPVRVTARGHTYRSTVASRGDRYLIESAPRTARSPVLAPVSGGRQGARDAQRGAKALTALAAEPRMHAAQLDEARLELLQQVDQLPALLLVEPPAQLVLVVDRDLGRPLEQGVSLSREVQPADPAVGRIGPPLQKAALFEGVYLGYHPAWRYPESISQRLLRLPLGRGHEAHQGELAGMDPERLELLGEAPGRCEAQLGEQEAHASGRGVRN